MPDVTVRGRRLGYGAQPADFDGSALTVVFLHGSGGNREDWSAQLEGLSDSVNTVALELPGHGASEPPGESSVEAYARWVEDFVGALDLKKVVLVGCSLGSAITQWLALSRGPWLKAIGLVGAGARLRVHPDFLEGLGTDSEKALRLLADFALSRSPDPSVHQAIIEKFQKCSAELVRGDLSACDEFDVMKRIAEISLPTKILVGEEDRLTPVKYSHFLHDNIPGSRLAVIPGAGHLVMVEKPEEFNNHLRHFLAKLPV
ncbi:MAG: alpha/beta fold hydrolase [Deltaproteobacteria bacterium]